MPFNSDEARREYVVLNTERFLPADLRDNAPAYWTPFVTNRSLFHSTQFEVNSAENQTKVAEDVTRAKAFLDAEIGETAEITGAMATRVPALIDLADACRTRANMTVADVRSRVTKAKGKRRDRIIAITLRALAKHVEFWEQDRTIDVAALREYVDRRLRIIEMVVFHVNTIEGSAVRAWKVTKTNGITTWEDGARNRLFEYPTIDAKQDFAGLFSKARGVDPDKFFRQDDPKQHYATPPMGTPQWDWAVRFQGGKADNMTWDRKPPYPDPPESVPPLSAADQADRPLEGTIEVNVRLPTSLERLQWRLSLKDRYTLKFYDDAQGLGNFVHAIDTMFKLRDNNADTRRDFFKRNWMNCDHVLAALQLEALLWAWRRRVPEAERAHAEQVLNDLAHNPPPGPDPHENRYVWLGAFIRSTSGNSTAILDGTNGNPMFRTRNDTVDELELGDQVIFNNSGYYDVFQTGLWRLENAIVTEFQERDDGIIDVPTIELRGHGLGGSLSDYLQEFVNNTQPLVTLALLSIKRELTTTPNLSGAKLITFPECEAIKWSPYPELQPGAANTAASVGVWWLAYPLTKQKTRGLRAPIAQDMVDAVRELPGAIGVDASGPTGHRIYIGERTSVLDVVGLKTIDVQSDFRPVTADHPTFDGTLYILLPLVQPKVSTPATGGLTAWLNYFTERVSPTTVPRLVEPLRIDSVMIPGLHNRFGKVWSFGPRIRKVLP